MVAVPTLSGCFCCVCVAQSQLLLHNISLAVKRCDSYLSFKTSSDITHFLHENEYTRNILHQDMFKTEPRSDCKQLIVVRSWGGGGGGVYRRNFWWDLYSLLLKKNNYKNSAISILKLIFIKHTVPKDTVPCKKYVPVTANTKQRVLLPGSCRASYMSNFPPPPGGKFRDELVELVLEFVCRGYPNKRLLFYLPHNHLCAFLVSQFY